MKECKAQGHWLSLHSSVDTCTPTWRLSCLGGAGKGEGVGVKSHEGEEERRAMDGRSVAKGSREAGRGSEYVYAGREERRGTEER